MKTWPSISLAECAEIVSGATPSTSDESNWGGDICWATPADLSELDGAYISDTPRKITAQGLASCSAEVLPPFSVLFSSRAPIGHVAINTVPMATNQGFKSFVPDRSRLDPKFLYYWLRTNRPYLESLGNGVTFKEVSKSVVSRIELPLPSLPEQRRIVDILDKADALLAKRRAGLAQLETLANSIFTETFGNPARNERLWPRRQLADLGRVQTGGTPPSSNPGMFGGHIPFITPGDLESDEPVRRTLTEEGASAVGTVPAGATLVCCIGATIGKIGKAQVRSAFNQQINAIEWGAEVERSFGYAVLRFFRPTIVAWGTSTTLPILKKSAFERIEIPVPPLQLQIEFAARSKQLDYARGKHRASLGQLTELFASLQQQAFRGEL